MGTLDIRNGRCLRHRPKGGMSPRLLWRWREAPIIAVIVMGALVGGLWAGHVHAAGASQVAIDADDASLGLVLELLSAGSSTKLVPHPEASDIKVSFAAKAMSRGSAVRWLCRTAGLSVVQGKSSQLLVGPCRLNPSVVKQYKISKVAADERAAESLCAFVHKVLFAGCLNREKDESGMLSPKLAVKWESGQMKVLAPADVQREVLALLKAMAAARPGGEPSTMVVKYSTYDLGLFRKTAGAQPPALKEKLSVELKDVPAADAARKLTSQAHASFFADPWDRDLGKVRVNLSAEGLPASAVAQKMCALLGAELLGYDGAWVFVREWRRPLYEGLVVRVYDLSGGMRHRTLADMVEPFVRRMRLPENLPYAIERVGDLYLVSAPGAIVKRLEDAMAGDFGQRGMGRWRDGMPPKMRDLLPRK